MSNIIEVTFGSENTVYVDTTPFQYNSGMVMQFTDIELPTTYQVHFSNSRDASTSLESIGTADGVNIPDDVWNNGLTIYAWIYLHPTETSGVTCYEVQLSERKRAGLPDGTEPTPTQQTVIDEAITALNNAVTVTNANVAQTQADVSHYPTVVNGYWCVYDAESDDWVSTGVRAEGTNGRGITSIAKTGTSGLVDTYTITFSDGTTTTYTVTNGTDGTDGVSPTVSVTDIDGGHTVTITDANGTQSFDVMDGETDIIKTPEETEADLYICDEDGDVIAEFADGHVKTKNFDSEDISERVASLEEEQTYIPDIMETDAVDADLDVTDSHGNVVARFAQGRIQTKNFDSSEAMERISNAEDDISDANKEITFMKRVRTRMCFGAHNGAEWYAPECTIPAYRIAGQQGWEWAWIAGISFSSEGSMYVLHDGTVDRTTDGTGSVATMTDAQIDALNITQTGAGYDLADFDPAELKIPTFEQVVQQCVKYGMKMVIRLSDFPNGTDTAENTAIWDNFLEVLNGYGVQPEDISCYLDSGTKAGTCRRLIGDNVEISTHLGQSATASDFVDWFESRSITGKKAAILSYQNTNLEAVKLLHSHGIRVYSYGYNSQAQADNCALWGVDIYQNGRIYKITD